MKLRIGEPYHVVYYAPLHVADRGGFFKREGLDVEIVPSRSFATSSAALQAGDMDVAVGGIMRSLVAYDRGEPFVPVHFARINDRDGFLLLGRQRSFDWPDLLGRRLIVFAEAPTPLQVLRSLLLDGGLNPDEIEVVADVAIDRVAEAYRAGAADYALTQAHVAEELVRSGDAVIVRAMATEAGPLPYSSYYCAPDYLMRAEDMVHRVARANAAAMGWIRVHSGEQIWETIAPAFAGEDPDILGAATCRYQALGAWSSDTTLPPLSYDRLATALRRGGLISRVAPYEAICRDQAARDAEASASVQEPR